MFRTCQCRIRTQSLLALPEHNEVPIRSTRRRKRNAPTLMIIVNILQLATHALRAFRRDET